MKKIMLAALVMTSLSAFAGDKGNGGETIDINGVPRLKDLVDTTVCRWNDGAYMMGQNPLTAEVLKKLSFLDWYFAADLKQEILDLDYCLTNNLKRIDTRDIDTLVATVEAGTRQAAIRINGQVFIDSAVLAAMPVNDRAYLLIHEAMHSYLAQDTFMRTQKLRSQVRAIQAVSEGTIATTKTFHLQMSNNEINFPLTVQALTPSRDVVMYLMSDALVRKTILMKQESIEGFLERLAILKPSQLASWHASALKATSLEEMVSMAIMNEDIELLEKFLKDSADIRSQTFSILYENDFAQQSEIIKAYLGSVENVGMFISTLLEDLAKPELSIEETRLMVSGMYTISAFGSEETPFTELKALDRDAAAALSPRMRVIFTFVKKLLKNGDMTLLGQLTFNNESFYEAFSNKMLKNSIAQMTIANPVEKVTAIRKVDTLLKGFWELLGTEVSAAVGAKKWKTFKSKINTEKLGYKI